LGTRFRGKAKQRRWPPVYLPIKLHNFVTPDRESRRTPNMDSDVPIVLLFLTLDA
jgi:hypothetical protein